MSIKRAHISLPKIIDRFKSSGVDGIKKLYDVDTMFIEADVDGILFKVTKLVEGEQFDELKDLLQKL